MIYKNNKRIKNGMKNMSFLGCLNNRMSQMPKLAKGVALRLAEKAKEEKSKEVSLHNKEKDNKNVRNKSTNIANNQQVGIKSIPNNNLQPAAQNPALMNRSGNGLRKPEVKLPKVPTIGNSSVSNTSMKAIW